MRPGERIPTGVPALVALLALACGTGFDDTTEPRDSGGDAHDAESDAGSDAGVSTLHREYDELWRIFAETYPYFLHKDIDWDALGERQRESLPESPSYDEWLEVVLDLLEPLHDNHVSLTTPDGERFVPGYVGWTANFDDDLVDATYLSATVSSDDVTWGTLSGNLGYVRVLSWGDASVEAALETALDDLRDTDGLVVDVRNNSGGDESLAVRVAGRFTESRVLYGHHRYRDGPAYDDFTELFDRFVEPTGPWRYAAPVAVLQGQRCMSSNEAFVAAMREIAGVVTVGATTRGSTGNPTSADLPSGTTVRLSTWIAYLPDMTVIEDAGIPPDVPAGFDESGPDLDGVLERAMELLAAGGL